MITQNQFFIACRKSNIDIVRQYIAEGGNVNIRDKCNWTGLMTAVWYGHVDCVQKLIEAGADVNRATQPFLCGNSGQSWRGHSYEKQLRASDDILLQRPM